MTIPVSSPATVPARSPATVPARGPATIPARSPAGARRRRTVGAVLAGLVLGLLAVLAGPASPASAHAVLVRTSPAKGVTVQAAPTEVVLTFSEAVKPVNGKVHIVGPNGDRVERGDPRADGADIRIPMAADAPAGTYLVTYRVVSADSHPIGGAYTFNIIAPSPGGPPSADGGNANANRIVTLALPVARWFGYVGLLLLVGSALMLAALWPRRLDRRGPIRLIWLGAGLVAAGAVAELLLQVPYVVGGGLFDIRGADFREVLSGQFGAAHLIRLGVLGAALILLRPISRGQGWGADRVLLAVLGVIGLATWSVSGHPRTSTVPMITVVADMIHLASMSVWLGGLVILAAFLLPRGTAAELGAIVPVWSRWATYAVSALILTGTAQALVEVATWSALFGTTYGRVVITKVVLAGAVLLVAWYSRSKVASIAAGGAEVTAPQLRRSVIVEAAIAAVILGVAATLVQVTPAKTVSDAANQPSLQNATMTSDLFMLQVEVDPAQVGTNLLHLYAFTPDGNAPGTVQEWVIKAALPAKGIEPITGSVVPFTLDHAQGEINLPSAGTWHFTFTLRVSDVDQRTVAADIPIRP